MVTPAGPSLRARARALPAFLGFAALGLLPLWLALSSLVPSLRAMLGHAPVVAFSPRDAIGLPLALLCFALAAMTLCPVAEIGPSRARKVRRQVDWLKVSLAVAASAILLTLVSVPVAEVTASWIMSGKGYTPCPAPARERLAPLRWAIGGGKCPA